MKRKQEENIVENDEEETLELTNQEEEYHEGGEEEANNQQQEFTPIEFSASELMQDMKKKKKRRKKQQQKNSDDDEQAGQANTTQKPFFVVDKKTIEKIDWKPPSDKNWLKGFFHSSDEQHDNHASSSSSTGQQIAEETASTSELDNEYMDDLDVEAQKYLLNVRFEAQNFCVGTVVASNIDSKDFESNRSSMRDMDQSLYSTIHLFDESSGSINVSSSWEESFMRSFKSQRNTIQTDIDKRLRGYTTASASSGNAKKFQHAYPPLNGHFDKWKHACLGEENVYILWEQYINKQNAADASNKEHHVKDQNEIETTSLHDTPPIDETTHSHAPSSSSSTANSNNSSMDETSDNQTNDTTCNTTKKKNRRGGRKRQKKDASEKDASLMDSALDTKIPTHALLTDYLDYLTIHALFSKMIHWTVSNFHNNSILRRKPSLVASLFNSNSDDEEEENEDKSEQSTNKEKWITNYLINESANSDNISRCNWLYHLFLAIDKPPNDTIGANMNQLLVWILEHFSTFTPEEKEEFKKLVIIIIKYFGQGSPSIIKYQDETNSSGNHTKTSLLV